MNIQVLEIKKVFTEVKKKSLGFNAEEKTKGHVLAGYDVEAQIAFKNGVVLKGLFMFGSSIIPTFDGVEHEIKKLLEEA